MMCTMAQPGDCFIETLKAYWFAPPVALWRAVELRTAAREHYAFPLLDLGCGDGLVAQLLFGVCAGNMAAPVDVGCDPWSSQLRKAARSGMYRHVDIAEGSHLPYPDATFATVFCNSVLEHIPDVQPVLREVRRVLKTEGRFIFTVPSETFRTMLDGYQRRLTRGDREGAERYAAYVDAWLEHHHYYAPEEWDVLLRAAGLERLRARYYMPAPAVRLWDRMNGWFGLARHYSAWRLLASPRLRSLGYQALLKYTTVRVLGWRWRPYYEMEVPEGAKGGGLLVVARPV
ncbi:MAG: class I SAM-dependent methyltransferase [Anaerolineae bacterium]|nr:class I SAM-dependent methyltransferase [Anaerolineae bacterium]